MLSETGQARCFPSRLRSHVRPQATGSCHSGSAPPLSRTSADTASMNASDWVHRNGGPATVGHLVHSPLRFQTVTAPRVRPSQRVALLALLHLVIQETPPRVAEISPRAPTFPSYVTRVGPPQQDQPVRGEPRLRSAPPTLHKHLFNTASRISLHADFNSSICSFQSTLPPWETGTWSLKSFIISWHPLLPDSQNTSAMAPQSSPHAPARSCHDVS